MSHVLKQAISASAAMAGQGATYGGHGAERVAPGRTA
jgi:hypothetical protein